MKRWRQSQDDQMSEHEDKIKDGNEKTGDNINLNDVYKQTKKIYNLNEPTIYIYIIYVE